MRLVIGPPAPIMPILPVLRHGEPGIVRCCMSCARFRSRLFTQCWKLGWNKHLVRVGLLHSMSFGIFGIGIRVIPVIVFPVPLGRVTFCCWICNAWFTDWIYWHMISERIFGGTRI